MAACANCGVENPRENRFCGACGHVLAVVCTGCGTSNPPDNRFCGSCGTALTAAAAAAPAPARETPVGTSTFQVVKNVGWVTPYLGCALVGFGLLYQFMFHLFGFIGKRSTPRPPTVPETAKKRRETRAPQTVP